MGTTETTTNNTGLLCLISLYTNNARGIGYISPFMRRLACNRDMVPPRTQLERQEEHHIAFGIIDLVTTKDLKGLVSTDLPGRFPFT